MKQRNTKVQTVMPQGCSGIDAHPTQDGQTQGDESFDTLSEQMPQMQALFEKLASQEHPDFMAVWQAISEMVAFYTEPRPVSKFEFGEARNESQKKCRFCV